MNLFPHTPAVLLATLFALGSTALGTARTSEPHLTPEVRAAQVDLEAERRELDARFKEDLEELAEWCTKKRIFAARATLYEELIRIDPDHTVARRGLGHTKDKDGVWHENENRIAPIDWSKKAAADFPAKRAALKTRYLDRMHELLQQSSKDMSEAEREQWMRAILDADPEDARIRAMLGEVKEGELWVLEETARAKLQRAAIKDAVREAIRTAPVAEPASASAAEDNLGIEWKVVRASSVARCLGTGDEAEVVRLIDAAHALRELFNFSFKTQAAYPDPLTLYSLAVPAEKDSFLANYPGLDESQRSFLTKLDGATIPGTWAFAQWAEAKARRVDGMVRLESSWLFANAFKLDSKHGWVLEGFGLYFTRELLGTRLTWFATPSDYFMPKEDHALQQRLLADNANWMAEADVILNAEKRPRLEFLLGKSVNQLSTPDLLYSYVMAAYLLEAEADSIHSLLAKLGEGQKPELVFQEVLGLDLVALDTHVRRWLSERK